MVHPSGGWRSTSREFGLFDPMRFAGCTCSDGRGSHHVESMHCTEHKHSNNIHVVYTYAIKAKFSSCSSSYSLPPPSSFHPPIVILTSFIIISSSFLLYLISKLIFVAIFSFLGLSFHILRIAFPNSCIFGILELYIRNACFNHSFNQFINTNLKDLCFNDCLPYM